MLRYLRRKTRIKPRAEFRISRQTISTVRPNDASTISPGSEIRSPKLSRQAGIYSKLSYIIDTEFEPDCGICYDLDARAFPLSIYLSRLDRLITSACSACAMLCTVLKPWEESFVEEGAYGLSLRVFDEGLNIRAFNDEYSDILNVMLCAPDDGPNSWTSTSERPLHRSVFEPEIATRTITKWLTECITSHDCGGKNEPPPLPRRALDIQGTIQVRLYLPEKGQRGRYACLSHCWGGVVRLQLTASTIEEFKEEIPWQDIPLTFKHAIDATSNMGIRYLWIDSLCILQDDLEDWRTEGSTIAATYSSAHLTLAATRSANSDGGLYCHPPWYNSTTGGIFPNTHQFVNKDESSYRICVTPVISSGYLRRSLPLQQRAWFFQEWILSQRIVHFADTMIYWECSQSHKGEASELLDQSVAMGHGVKIAFASLTGRCPDDLSVLSNLDFHTLIWHQIVTSYSSLQLTYITDTLPALQGITNRMADERGCRFYAGLWEDSLITDLLWLSPDRRFEATEHSPCKDDYLAPSWSWASHVGSVEWRDWIWVLGSEHKQPFIAEVSVMSIMTTTASNDPFGQVLGGELMLKGLCLPAVCTLDKCGKPWIIPTTGNKDWCDDLFCTQNHYLGVDQWCPDSDDRPAPDTDLLLMLMGLWPRPTLDGTSIYESWFLAFERASLVGEVYKRTGLLRTGRLAYRARFLREAIEQELTII